MSERLRIRPEFYPEFNCTADACDLTCCQEWRIHVDPSTRRRWEGLSLDGKPLLDQVRYEANGNGVLRLNDHGKCAFLDQRGLCRLVLNYGDEMLSDTCALFPRQIRHTRDRSEYALLTGCPEVMEHLRKADRFRVNHREAGLPLTDGEIVNDDDMLTLPALRLVRERLIDLLYADGFTLRDSLLTGFYLLLELWEQEPCPTEAADLIRLIGSPEKVISFLPAIHEQRPTLSDALSEVNELLLDLSANYYSEGHYREFLRPLRESAGLFSPSEWSDWTEFETFLDAYRPLFRNVAASELFSSFLSDRSTLEAGIRHVQWILMKLAAIRHSIYLLWHRARSENRGFSWPEVRMCFCILSRMTGYDDRDMEEYLRSMFGHSLWEWGYASLILGHFT